MKSLLLSLFVSLFSVSSGLTQAVPAGMTYQGRLTDTSGAPVPDGIGYEIEVRLWNASTGGTLLWGSRYTGVPLKSGALNLILGSGGTPIVGAATTDLKAAFSAANVHLGLTATKNATGVSIPSPSEILPRQQIFSSPYAFRAEVASAAALVQTDGVLSASVKDGEITSADLANSSVIGAKIATSSITGTHVLDGSIGAADIAPGLPMSVIDLEYAKFVDEKPGGTGGGSFTASAFNKRTLNTTVFSKGTSISRSGDNITLQPGTYWIKAYAPTVHVSQVTFLRDASGKIIMRGTHGNGGYYQTADSFLNGVVVVPPATPLELSVHTYTEGGGGSGASLGAPAAIPNPDGGTLPEVYTEVFILRIK